ncbi:MAG: methyltransferase domain-containing protein [Lentisphaerae bacterium]|nr:MAG: methyltransferase domain-containing protein [Lentisphaerota bacterium]
MDHVTGDVGREDIRAYYGRVLSSKNDLKTNACCCSGEPSGFVREILDQMEGEILDRFYGCGSPIPLAVEGCRVLDLGCGTGRDVYILSRLVGAEGEVIGVDMTEEQLAIGRKYQAVMADRFGYSRSNVRFLQGYMEELEELGVEDESVDVVISNCVVNLSFDKERLFREVFRVLKTGGEFCFSDVFASRRLPREVQNDPIMVGECIGGALYVEDLRRLAQKAGFMEVREVSSAEITVHDERIAAMLAGTKLYSKTVKMFKLPDLEDRCEDYGQTAVYLGTIAHEPLGFRLDNHHYFERGRWTSVCGNTASILTRTRLAPHFRVEGDRSTHFGLFSSCQTSAENTGTTSFSCC